MQSPRPGALLVALFTAPLLAACAAAPPVVDQRTEPNAFLECAHAPGQGPAAPIDTLIGNNGATIRVGAHQVRFPRGARPTAIRLRIGEVQGNRVGVFIHRVEGSGPVTYAVPIRVTLDAGRCAGVNRSQWSNWRFATEPALRTSGDRLPTELPWWPLFNKRLRSHLGETSWVVIAD